MNTVRLFFMKLSFNKLIVILCLAAWLSGQSGTPYRFALRSADGGEISYFEDGFSSNVVAEIRTMGDSLTWFGTGRGLSMHDGHFVYTYQTTFDSLVSVIDNPSANTYKLPIGGVSAIATGGDTMAIALAGDDGDTPMGMGLALTTSAESWYDIPPQVVVEFDFIWDSLGINTPGGLYFGWDSEYVPGVGYSGDFMVVSPTDTNDRNTLLDSIQTGNIIEIKNNDGSKVLKFTVESDTTFGTGDQVSISIQSGSIEYTSSEDIGFNDGENVSLGIAKVTKAIEWKFLSQPIDLPGDTIVPFGEGYYRQLPVTVAQANVTYDASISGKFLWIASWAGGLRRFDLSSTNLRKAENVPMPMDDQVALSTCQDTAFVDTTGESILKDYYLNPRDPEDGGNHNHKAFSVLAFGDTVWVGTANGINRGLIIEEIVEVDTNQYEVLSCIEWEHYKYPNDGLSGNFVVGLAMQDWNGQRTIWAATMNASELGEVRGLSYTRDAGTTWQTALLGERVYNIEARDSLVFAATSSGLWKSLDGENWALFDPAIDQTILAQKQILTNTVYALAIEDRDTIPRVWIGTPDGAALSADIHGSSWEVYQSDHDPTEIYAYPNPFSPLTHNQLNNDGYVRFHTGQVANSLVKLNIFNFAMERVHSHEYDLNTYQGALKWDGRGLSGDHVANGVYFIRMNYSTAVNKAPADFWTKLIVVK